LTKRISILFKEDDNISPSQASLFKQQIGNLTERFKLTETTCESLLDQFDDFKKAMSRIKKPAIETDDTDIIVILSSKITTLATRNEKLKAELCDMEAKLKSFKCTNCERQALFPDEEEQNKTVEEVSFEINTQELVQKVTNLRIRLGLTVRALATILGFSYDNMARLIRSPDPWSLQTPVKKKHYRKLHNWFVKNVNSKKTCSNPSTESLVKRKKKSTIGTNGGFLNITQVCTELKQMLDRANINYGHFAHHKLYTTSAYFDLLLSCSTPWESLNDRDKGAYHRMYNWTQASQDEIAALKQLIENKFRRDTVNRTFYKGKKVKRPVTH
jgi:hypothetical protein